MKYLMLLLFFLFNSQAVKALDSSVSQAGEYAKAAMMELASDPPLIMLQNEEGKSRHELALGYMKLKSDDNDVTLSGGVKATEKGSAKGYGFGYGYSHSFKDKWAFVSWLQAVTVEKGNHDQFVNGRLSARAIDFDSLNINLALGVSYEFFRENDKHVLNVFGGPSFMYLDFHSDIETYSTDSPYALSSSLDFFFSKFIPAAMAGFMYEYRFFEDWIIAPYSIGVISLVDKCQPWEADRVSVNTGGVNGSSPECAASNTASRGEIDIAPSFITVGVKFNYKPWDLGFNISSVIRNAILRPEEERKAEIETVLFSLSKDWGDY